MTNTSKKINSEDFIKAFNTSVKEVETMNKKISFITNNKITFTSREILSIIKSTADLYNNRTVSRERYEHVCEILDRCEFMSFKRLCELTVIAVETIEGQPVYDYLLDRFNRNDKMSYIVRHLYD